MIVAIDGPCGSGKGTIAKILAKKCNLTYIDTGAMYRAIAYATILENVAIDDEEGVIRLASTKKISFDGDKVLLDGVDVSKEIRTMEVTNIVSPLSSNVKLREIMVDLQREMGSNGNVIMEGRDITTVVFPNANFKFYLDATLDERVRRRYEENKVKNIDSTYEEVYENIKNRDYNDMHKEVGALKRTDDQIYVDSTNLSIDEVVDLMLKKIEGE